MYDGQSKTGRNRRINRIPPGLQDLDPYLRRQSVHRDHHGTLRVHRVRRCRRRGNRNEQPGCDYSPGPCVTNSHGD